MLKRVINFICLFSLALVIINCANRGNPSGGEKDTTPPLITKTSPENYSTNFNAREIKIHFDEYVKIKNLQRNLIISPPMDPAPEITPLGSASKYITIKIYDTLSPNTTYAFNFGESIVDNNEENPYQFYRYVFSTGEFIDSLSVSGSITDALKRTTEEFVSVMLYEVDSTFNDSVIYKEKPKYITNTLDSTTTFSLENIKAGKYLMMALKDENSNYTFDQKNDKIGFVDQFIDLPTDSSYTIELFKEKTNFKATRPNLISGQKIAFGYEGGHEGIQIKMLSPAADTIRHRITKDQQTDTLYYWYTPKIVSDSLFFELRKDSYIDTLTVRLKDQLRDSLRISAGQSRTIEFDDPFELEANTPFENIDEKKISFLDKDSIAVPFSTSLDTLNNKYQFNFDKTEDNSYTIGLLPGTITDLFGDSNDSLSYSFRTRSLADYGNVRLNLRNATYPVIVQLINENEDIIVEKYSTKPEAIDFNNVTPGMYYLRVIFDANANGIYDPGNYLQKIQSERVSYYPNIIDVRASWNLIEEFILQD
ncbi:MAG: Ig-like domain-containing protein [Flavobacteriaceae bacterium]|nr:Ig-like domain-containing protein [Flavobacteriaceae bacterium]